MTDTVDLIAEINTLKDQFKQLRFITSLKANAEHRHAYHEVDGVKESFDKLLEVMAIKDHGHSVEGMTGLEELIAGIVEKEVAKAKETWLLSMPQAPVAPVVLSAPAVKEGTGKPSRGHAKDIKEIKLHLDGFNDKLAKLETKVNNNALVKPTVAAPVAVQEPPKVYGSVAPYIVVGRVPSEDPAGLSFSLNIVNPSGYCVCNAKVAISIKTKGQEGYKLFENKPIKGANQICNVYDVNQTCESVSFKLLDDNNSSLVVERVIRVR